MASQIALKAHIPIDIIKRGLEICQLMSENKRIDCFVSHRMKLKNRSLIELSQKFLRLEIRSEVDIKNFIDNNFCQYSASEE